MQAAVEVEAENVSPEDEEMTRLEAQFSELISSKAQLYKKPAFLPGYPAWYRSLCDKDQDGLIGPAEMTTSAQVVPKLLKLTWDGYPLYHNRELGWGYLVPGRPLEYCRTDADPAVSAFPLKKALELFPPRESSTESVEMNGKTLKGIISIEEAMRQLQRMTEMTADQESLVALRQVVIQLITCESKFDGNVFVFNRPLTMTEKR